MDARCARFALLAGCTPGRSRARAGAPTRLCPRVGAPLERPRALQARSLPLFCPPSARVPEARAPVGEPGAHLERRGAAGLTRAPSTLRPLPASTSSPAHLVPGLPEPEAHVCSARRPRQGWPGRGARPSASAFCRTVTHTRATHTRRGARRQGAGGSTCSSSGASISSPTAALAGCAGRCVGATWPPVGLCMGLVRRWGARGCLRSHELKTKNGDRPRAAMAALSDSLMFRRRARRRRPRP